MKKRILITAAVSSFAAASYLAVGNFFYEYALKTKKKKLVEENDPTGKESLTETDLANLAFLEKHPPREKHLVSKDKRALKLHASFYPQAKATHQWAIVVHGYTSHNREMTQWTRGFFEKGLNVLTPDLRGHGTSDGDYIGMGWHDRMDILSWVNTIIAEDSEAEIILFGVSMGGATVMMVAGEDLPENVKVIVEDCGYTSARSVLSYQLKEQFNLPEFPAMQAVNTVAKIRAGYYLFEASAVKQLSKAKVPILFIHGEEDTFVPYQMMDDLYAAARTEKEKLTIPGAEHAEAVNVDPELYWNTIWKFAGRFMDVSELGSTRETPIVMSGNKT